MAKLLYVLTRVRYTLRNMNTAETRILKAHQFLKQFVQPDADKYSPTKVHIANSVTSILPKQRAHVFPSIRQGLPTSSRLMHKAPSK